MEKEKEFQAEPISQVPQLTWWEKEVLSEEPDKILLRVVNLHRYKYLHYNSNLSQLLSSVSWLASYLHYNSNLSKLLSSVSWLASYLRCHQTHLLPSPKLPEQSRGKYAFVQIWRKMCKKTTFLWEPQGCWWCSTCSARSSASSPPPSDIIMVGSGLGIVHWYL